MRYRNSRTIIGLMSGTSCDGIDACLTRIAGTGRESQIEIIAFKTYRYDPQVRERILEVCQPESGTVEKVCSMNFLLGELFAEAAMSIAEEAEAPLNEIDSIGSHGQTIYHIPAPVEIAGKEIASTLQIGEPSVIAQRTGITTVADFRTRDIAAGGQGAPLVPYADYLLFQDGAKGRAIQNIGGIANVTFLPARGSLDNVLAFDTGPGNMVIDRVTQLITNGKLNFDDNGDLAARGKVNHHLLEKLLSHDFLERQPPKTTGREEFGTQFADELYYKARTDDIIVAMGSLPVAPVAMGSLPVAPVAMGSLPVAPVAMGSLPVAEDLDILATVTAFTAKTIADSYQKFILPHGEISEAIVCGGGSHNQTLLRFLGEFIHPIPVRKIEEFGINSDAKEALSFALLANETMAGRPNNVPKATGAREAVVLGKIVPGRRCNLH